MWRFDFAWPQFMVAVEVEGGIWNNGAHVRGKHVSSDCEKASEAAIAGWRVLRVTGDQIKAGLAIGWIERAINAAA
jgi:very-short-patch-repair endonuclease